MVSVTTKNFEDQLKIFAEKLNTCSFVSFDEEMTGITLDSTQPTVSDSAEARYQKMKTVSKTFNLIQVGFCFFHEQADGSFVGFPFNFFVFPPPFPRKLIQMGSDTADFHRKNCMNFNEWIYFGIPYINTSEYEKQEKLIKAPATEEEEKDSKKRLSISKKEDKEFISHMLQHLESWLEARKGDGKAEALPQVDGAEGEDSAEPAMEVESTTASAEADGAASAPPAEVASAEEAPAEEAVAPAAAEAPAADSAPAVESTSMEVEGEAADAPKVEEANAADEAPVEGAKAEEHPKETAKPAKAAPKHSFPDPTHTDTEFVIPDCNSFLRKALYQEIGSKHPSLHLSSKQSGSDSRHKGIVVALEAPKDDKEEKLAALEAQSGFRRVYKLLADSKKPLVGHNCLYDLLFLTSHFEGDLPDTLKEWKEHVHERFPTIYDTKVLAYSHGHVDTALGSIFKSAKGGPVVNADPAAAEYVTREGQHEAGFDAWMTGAVFARLGGPKLLSEPGNKLENRLNLMRSLHRLNLSGEDDLIGGAIFHASGFGEETKTDALLAFFGSPIHVRGVSSGVSQEQFEAELGKFGALEFSLLAPHPDGKSSGSGFAAFKEAAHSEAAISALDGAKGHFGDSSDAALEAATLRVSVQWIDSSSAYLVLPFCSDSEGSALLALRSESADFKVVTLEESKRGHGKQTGNKRGRQSGAAAAEETPNKGGRKGRASNADEAPPAATTPAAAKGRKGAAAPTPEIHDDEGGRGGRKRGRASVEEVEEEEAAPAKKPARGGRHSKGAVEDEEPPESAPSPAKPAGRATKRGGKKEEEAEESAPPAKATGGRSTKKGGKSAAKEEDNAEKEAEKEEEKEEEKVPDAEESKGEEEKEKEAAAASPAKPAGRAGRRGAKSTPAELEKVEEPAPAKAAAGKGAKKGGKAAKEAEEVEKAAEEDKMEEDKPAAAEEEAEAEEAKEQAKGAKGKGRGKGKEEKAPAKAEPAAPAGKSPRGKAAAEPAPAPSAAEADDSKGRRRSGRH